MHQNDKTLKQAIPKKDEKLNLKIQQRLKAFLLVRIIKHQKPKLSLSYWHYVLRRKKSGKKK